MVHRSGISSTSAEGELATLKSLLEMRAQVSPNSMAFTFWSSGQAIDRLTYAELHVAASAAAEKFVDAGCRGASIVLVHPPGLDFLVDFFGCIYAGAQAVPLPMPTRGREHDRFDRVTRLIQPKLVVAPSDGVSEDTFGQWCHTWPDLAFHRSSRCTTAFDSHADLSGDDTAVIQFTSGSSSSPRGAILSHSAIMANLKQIHQAFDFRAAERYEAVVLWLPHYHDMGLFGRLECIYAGCACHIMSPLEFTKRPMRWLELVAKTKATVTGAPNFAFDLCAELGSSDRTIDLDLSGLRIAFCGAEPINAATLDRFEAAFCSFGLSPTALLPCYGLAEATLIVSSHIPGRNRSVVAVDAHALGQGRLECIKSGTARQLVSCGRIVSGMQVAIVDPATRSALPSHAVGEIWISGPNVSSGYVGDDGTPSTLVTMANSTEPATHYLPTGDLGGYIDDELFVVGRIKNSIIVHGRNLYPHDLEGLVPACHPILALCRTAAIATAGPNGELPALIIEVRRDAERRAAELRDAVESVAGEIRRQFENDPARVVIVRRGAIAWTTSGKIAYGETALRYHRGELHVLADWPTTMPAGRNAPETVEDVILGVVGAVLGRDAQPDSGFREIGGDSLAAHRTAARLRRSFGSAFREHELFMEFPIREISRLVDLRLTQFVEEMSEQEVAAALRAIGDSAPDTSVRQRIAGGRGSGADGPSNAYPI